MIFGLLISFFYFGFSDVTMSVQGAQPPPSLPLCIDSPQTIKKIKTIQIKNGKNSLKYNGYKEALRSSSDSELIARLAYSEFLGARCPHLQTPVLSRIIEVITNRVRARRGDIQSVVFQKDQFASSLNIYSESHYKDFLCPKDSPLWQQALTLSQEKLNSSSRELDLKTVHYFLYQHSPRWPKEPSAWKVLQEELAGTTPEIQQCIRFFKGPSWK